MSDATPESKVSYLPGARPVQSDEPASLTTTLAALLHADVADSTRIVQVDERVARRSMRDVFERLARTVAEHDGQTREIRGDVLVAQFHRASDASTAAIASQFEHATHVKVSAASIFAHVRIGIALTGFLRIYEERVAALLPKYVQGSRTRAVHEDGRRTEM